MITTDKVHCVSGYGKFLILRKYISTTNCGHGQCCLAPLVISINLHKRIDEPL